MLFQILRSFKSLAAISTTMRLVRNVNANMRGDMVALDRSDLAVIPVTIEGQIVSDLATDMIVGQMSLDIRVSKE